MNVGNEEEGDEHAGFTLIYCLVHLAAHPRITCTSHRTPVSISR